MPVGGPHALQVMDKEVGLIVVSVRVNLRVAKLSMQALFLFSNFLRKKEKAVDPLVVYLSQEWVEAFCCPFQYSD